MNLLKLSKQGLIFTISLIALFTVLVSSAIVSAQPAAQPANVAEPPAVEWLKFQVPSQQQARFVEQDAAIWTPVLSSYPGFQGKEIWVNPDRPDELVIIAHWASLAQWQAIPKDILDRTTQKFHQAMGTEYVPESMAFRLIWRSN